jgi:hypothetical protein
LLILNSAIVISVEERDDRSQGRDVTALVRRTRRQLSEHYGPAKRFLSPPARLSTTLLRRPPASALPSDGRDQQLVSRDERLAK